MNDENLIDDILDAISDVYENDASTHELTLLLVKTGLSRDVASEFVADIQRLDGIRSEAENSPEEENIDDWEEIESSVNSTLNSLSPGATLEDAGVLFPYERWEEGLYDREAHGDDEDTVDDPESGNVPPVSDDEGTLVPG